MHFWTRLRLFCLLLFARFCTLSLFMCSERANIWLNHLKRFIWWCSCRWFAGFVSALLESLSICKENVCFKKTSESCLIPTLHKKSCKFLFKCTGVWCDTTRQHEIKYWVNAKTRSEFGQGHVPILLSLFFNKEKSTLKEAITSFTFYQ